MGFILAALIGVVAAVAIGVVWRQYRREVRRLRSAHNETVQKISQEHRQRLKRLDREHDRELRVAHHPLVRDLLPALDSLDEALDHLQEDDDATSSSEKLDDLIQGLKLARNAIYDALARHDIEAVVPEQGETFDPEVHEAIARRETRDDEPQTVHRLFRRGYRDGQGLLRSALVEVNVEPNYASESDDIESDSDADELESSGESMAGKEDARFSEEDDFSEEVETLETEPSVDDESSSSQADDPRGSDVPRAD